MLNGVIEIIVFCFDMHAQVAFYRDVLGLSVTYPQSIDANETLYWVTFQTGACTLALHFTDTNERGADATKFVFGSDDVDAARAELTARGVKVSEIRAPAPGIRVFDGWDPEGNVFSVEAQRAG